MLFTNSIRFPNMFDIDSGQTKLDGGITSINRCIGLILTSAKGELFGDPEYGSDLYALLFNQFSMTLVDTIKDVIVRDITQFESRVVVTTDDIEIEEIKDRRVNAFKITIKYMLKNSSESGSTIIEMEDRGNG